MSLGTFFSKLWHSVFGRRNTETLKANSESSQSKPIHSNTSIAPKDVDLSKNDACKQSYNSDKLKTAIEKSRCEISKLESDIASNEQKLKNYIREEGNNIEDLVSNYTKDVLEIKSRLNETKTYLSTLNNELQAKDVQIEELEEEIDDLEDDAKRNKKKIEEAQNKNREMEAQIHTYSNEITALKNNLNDVNANLEEKNNELQGKENVIEFTRDILSAKISSDESAKELRKNVDAFISFVSGDLYDCIKENIDIWWSFDKSFNLDDFFNNRAERWAVLQKKSWLKGKKTIAFIGEFSAGKTSIVNRFLYSPTDASNTYKERIELPVSAKATTAIPTYIYSKNIPEKKQFHYQFVSPDNKLKEISENVFKNASKEILEQAEGIHSLLKYFVLSCPNPNLKDISILDTPGFSSNDSEDAIRTIDVINECDALFWVIDINKGELNKSSIKTIKDHLKKPLYIIVNKADTKESYEIENAIGKIKDTAQKNGLIVKDYVAFSQRAKIDILMDIINRTENSNDDNYTKELEELLKSLQDILTKAKNSIDKEYKDACQIEDELTNVIESELRALNCYCEQAAKIPHYESHFWSDNKYEMSIEEFANMGKKLVKVCEKSEIVIESNNKQDEAIKKGTEIKIKRNEIYKLSSRFDELFNKFKKLRDNIKSR